MGSEYLVFSRPKMKVNGDSKLFIRQYFFDLVRRRRAGHSVLDRHDAVEKYINHLFLYLGGGIPDGVHDTPPITVLTVPTALEQIGVDHRHSNCARVLARRCTVHLQFYELI